MSVFVANRQRIGHAVARGGHGLWSVVAMAAVTLSGAFSCAGLAVRYAFRPPSAVKRLSCVPGMPTVLSGRPVAIPGVAPLVAEMRWRAR